MRAASSALGEEAIQRLRQHEIVGQVRLGVMDDYGTVLMPPILKAFYNSYPGIKLHMETGLTASMIGRVGKAYDVVIAMHGRNEAQGLAVTVVKEGTFPRSLRMLGTEDGLPALPTAEIRLHASRTVQPPAILLARHLRDHFKAVHRRTT